MTCARRSKRAALKEKAAKAAEKAAKKAEKAAEAAAKKAEKAVVAAAKKAKSAAEAARKKAEKAAQDEKRRADQREQQEQREREREDAEIEAMLRSLPPSVLDGSSASNSFTAIVRRCARAVADGYKHFAPALEPLHNDTVTSGTRPT